MTGATGPCVKCGATLQLDQNGLIPLRLCQGMTCTGSCLSPWSGT